MYRNSSLINLPTDTKFEIILVIIIDKILYPTTIQRVFPFFIAKILFSCLGKTGLCHNHHLGLIPYFQFLYSTISKYPYYKQGLEFSLWNGALRLHPQFLKSKFRKEDAAYMQAFMVLQLTGLV